MKPLVSPEMRSLAAYLAAAHSTPLPDTVVEKTVIHIVDTLAAVTSGARLEPGEQGIRFARTQGGEGRSTVVGAGFQTTPMLAALANGMSAHADETDDSHAFTISHPGCGVVPSAVAVAQELGRSGSDVVRAVAAGYDVGTRVVLALGPPKLNVKKSGRSTHALVSLFGAAVAAAVLYRLDERGMRHMLSYAAQSAAGVTSWVRDTNHVEKAFVFAGRPASDGVRAAALVASGCDGVDDVFSEQPNFLDAISEHVDRSQLIDGLGERFEIIRTNIKKFAVGSPAQAAVQAAINLMQSNKIDLNGVLAIDITLPHDLASVVDNREMPDINCQYLVAGTLLDGAFSFLMAHDSARMQAPDVKQLMAVTRLHADPALSGQRSAELQIRTREQGTFYDFVPAVRGTFDDPMTVAEVDSKAVDLLDPILGSVAARQLLDALWVLPALPSMDAIMQRLDERVSA